MFLKKFSPHIWKQTGIWSLIVTIMLSFLVIAAPVRAAGETYTWNGAGDNSSFTGASGSGVYTSDVVFNRTGVTGGTATYSATATYTCLTDKTTHTDTLTATIAAAAYAQASVAPSTTASLSGGAVCASLGPDIGVNLANTSSVTGASTAAAAAAPACDQGSLSWMFCPVIDNISKTVANIAKSILVPLLQVNTINQASTPQIYQVWTHVRDFANILFILVFFAIILSTMLQQDIGGLNPYTIKSTWVRLIFAAIMVQLSFYISGFIVDIGNVLGVGVGSLLGSITGNAYSPASTSNLIGNMVTTSVGVVVGAGALILATWEIAIPVLLGLLITLLIAFLTLGARFLIIAILVVVSPLAFVAWVLPNTRHYTSDWTKLLMRLMLMYPIIIGIFTLAGTINEILPFTSDAAASGPAALATRIIKPIITIAIFLAIPESFRLAGRGLARLNGLLNGVGLRGKGLLKGSAIYKEGQRARKERQASLMQSMANSATVTGLTNSDSRVKRAAGKGFLTASGLALAGASSSPKGIQASYKNAQAERVKSLKDFDNVPVSLIADAVMASYGDSAKMDKIKREAPVLVEYTKTLAGRAALAGRANEAGVFNFDHIRQIQGSSLKNEFSTLQPALDKNGFAENPHLHRLDSNGLARPDFGDNAKTYTAGTINTKLNKTLWESAAGQKQTRTDGSTYYRPDNMSQSMTKQIVQNASPDQLGGIFDSTQQRTFGSKATRLAVLQWAGSNITTLQASENGRATLEAIRHNISRPTTVMVDETDPVTGKVVIDPTTSKARQVPKMQDIIDPMTKLPVMDPATGKPKQEKVQTYNANGNRDILSEYMTNIMGRKSDITANSWDPLNNSLDANTMSKEIDDHLK